jgi:hypothetical protein
MAPLSRQNVRTLLITMPAVTPPVGLLMLCSCPGCLISPCSYGRCRSNAPARIAAHQLSYATYWEAGRARSTASHTSVAMTNLTPSHHAIVPKGRSWLLCWPCVLPSRSRQLPAPNPDSGVAGERWGVEPTIGDSARPRLLPPLPSGPGITSVSAQAFVVFSRVLTYHSHACYNARTVRARPGAG